MTTQIRAWRPIFPLATQTLVVTGASQFMDLSATTPGVCALRVANIGTAVVFVEQVESAATAATVLLSVPVLPNTVEMFTFPNDKIGLAIIGDGVGTSTLYVTPGEGL